MAVIILKATPEFTCVQAMVLATNHGLACMRGLLRQCNQQSSNMRESAFTTGSCHILWLQVRPAAMTLGPTSTSTMTSSIARATSSFSTAKVSDCRFWNLSCAAMNSSYEKDLQQHGTKRHERF